MAITRSRRSAGSPLGSPQPPQLSHKTNVLRAMHTKKREARLSHRVSVSQISRRRVARCVLITPKTTHNRSQEGVAEELRTTNRLSRVSLKLQRMRPDTALRYLTRKRHITRGNCWLRRGCKARYPEVDLRHTKMDDNPSEKWRHKFKLATLANVARGRATDLLAITRPAGKGKAYDVSHLCHQKKCFNPSHVVVEKSSVNHLRKSCLRRFETLCKACQSEMPTCDHHKAEGDSGRKCIQTNLESISDTPCDEHARARVRTLRPRLVGRGIENCK